MGRRPRLRGRDADHAVAAGRGGLRRVADRLAPRGEPRGLRRLPDARVHDAAHRGAGQGQGDRPDLRQAVHPALGHVERRPPRPHLRRAGCRWDAGRRDEGHGRRLAVEALRRQRRIRLHARRTVSCLHRPRCGPQRGVVDELRSLRRAHRRQCRPAQPHDGQRRLGHEPGLLARRQADGLSRDVAGRVRGRSLPHHGAAVATGRSTRRGRQLGPLAERTRVVGRQHDPVRNSPQRGTRVAVRDRRRDGQREDRPERRPCRVRPRLPDSSCSSSSTT